MPEYHFVTEWDLPAPPDMVSEVIGDSLRWPEWWRGIRAVTELSDHEPQGLGNRRRYVFRPFLPYDLVFDMRVTRFEPPAALSGVDESARTDRAPRVLMEPRDRDALG